MIGLDSKVSEEQRFPAGVRTAAVRFDGDKYGVNLSQGFGVI
jgi:hypothetical protein